MAIGMDRTRTPKSTGDHTALITFPFLWYGPFEFDGFGWNTWYDASQCFHTSALIRDNAEDVSEAAKKARTKFTERKIQISTIETKTIVLFDWHWKERKNQKKKIKNPK